MLKDKLAGRVIDIATRDGRTMAAELFAKPGAAGPGIVMVPAVFGIDDDARIIAWDYVEQGYPVLALDFFHRIHPGALAREGEGREKAMARYQGFDAEQGVQDLGDAVEQFRRMTECNGKVAVFGYCFGGRYAYLAAAHGIADAAVSFHGTKIGLDLAKAAAIASPLQLHCGAVDPQVPMEEVERTKQALAGNSQAQIFVYPGAAHGFTGKGRPSYQEVADVGSRHAALALLGLLR
jgi:carboxymethylenebutenolidase